MSLRLKEYETTSAKSYNLLRTSLIYSFDLPAIILLKLRQYRFCETKNSSPGRIRTGVTGSRVRQD